MKTTDNAPQVYTRTKPNLLGYRYTGKNPEMDYPTKAKEKPLAAAVNSAIMDTLQMYGHVIPMKETASAYTIAREINRVYATTKGKHATTATLRNHVFYLFNIALDLYNRDEAPLTLLYRTTPAALRSAADIERFYQDHGNTIKAHILKHEHPLESEAAETTFYLHGKTIAHHEPGIDDPEEIKRLIITYAAANRADPTQVRVITRLEWYTTSRDSAAAWSEIGTINPTLTTTRLEETTQ